MNTHRILLNLVLVVVGGVVLAACACPGISPVDPTEEPMATEGMTSTDEPMPTEAMEATEEMEATEVMMATEEPMGPSAEWQADGTILEGEYAHETTIGEVTLWWRNDAEFLYLAMEAATTGWVSVGLDPEVRMEGANFLFGVVVAGEARVWDAYGTAPTGNTHPPDEDLGGTNDIVAYAGVEEAGITRLEMQIPLDSGDEFDKPLQSGETVPVIVAVGPSDAFDSRHTSRAGGSITLD